MATVTVSSADPSFSSPFMALNDNLPAPAGRPGRECHDICPLRLAGDDGRQGMAFNPVNYLGSGRKKMAAAAQEDELDVFAAEKYFSGGMDGDEAVAELGTPWKASTSTGPPRARSAAGPPSMCSETSGNSRSALPLRESRRRRPTGLRRHPRPGSRKFLGIFPCSCSDKRAVEVHKDGEGRGSGDRGNYNPAGRPLGAPCKQPAPELRCHQEEWRRMSTDGSTAGGAAAGFPTKTNFTFPPVSQAVAAPTSDSTEGVQAHKLEVDHYKLSRISPLEVLGTSPALVGMESEVSGNIRRQISLTIRSPYSPRTSGGGGAVAAAAKEDEEAFSESSSELFEIESFSTGTVPVGGPGGTSASATGYEPSEASFVAAGAAYFGRPPKGSSTSGNEPQNQRQPPGAGLLQLGCGGARAVNVVPSKHHRAREKVEAITPDQIRHRSESPVSASDFQPGEAGPVSGGAG